MNCFKSMASASGLKTLASLTFDNRALRQLPLDSETKNVPRQVKGACFSRVDPTPVDNPRTVVIAFDVFRLLDISESEFDSELFPEYFSGNKLLPGSEPAAHCYCGHQFGYFSGQLGDGAAIYLGEVISSSGQRHEIQLKGAGPTPYSRTADGRKVLRSTIREFLCSEAMHSLGVPTTRAGCVITSDTKVMRDVFYDGHPTYERATQVLRLAPTFIRFGSFEVTLPTNEETGRCGPSEGDVHLLTKLVHYTIESFYPEIWSKHQAKPMEMYVEFFKEVVRRTARLVADWQCIGWCHGVLNTDNMSIVGATIDYGPFGFMDIFNPDFICNASDDGGRYTYEKQPEICRWNCLKLAESLSLLVPLEMTKAHLALFDSTYEEHYKKKMRLKFGLQTEQGDDSELFQSFMDTMATTGADFTNAFRSLSIMSLPGCADHSSTLAQAKQAIAKACCSADALRMSVNPQMDARQLQVLAQVIQTRPELANMLAKQLQSFKVELKKQEKLEKIRTLTDEQKRAADSAAWDKWFSLYVKRLEKEGCTEEANARRRASMNKVNPRYILRNYIAQNAIELAEKGDYSEVQRVLERLKNPYSTEPCETAQDISPAPDSFQGLRYDCPPPMESLQLKVT